MPVTMTVTLQRHGSADGDESSNLEERPVRSRNNPQQPNLSKGPKAQGSDLPPNINLPLDETRCCPLVIPVGDDVCGCPLWMPTVGACSARVVGAH